MNTLRYSRQWLSAGGLLVMAAAAALFVYLVNKVQSLQ
jgi:hypothetical protein